MSDDASRRASPESEPGRVGRRAVVAGAAWSVPAIALAVATPASAASTDGTITFDSVVVTVDHSEDPIILDGVLSAGTRPAVVSLTYSAGFSGDATAIVNADSGAFRATSYAASGPSTGTCTASAPGYRSASVGLEVLAL